MSLIEQAIKRCEEQKIRILSSSSPDWAESAAFAPAATRLLLAFLQREIGGSGYPVEKQLLLFCKPHRARRDSHLRELSERAVVVANRRRK